jgi:hypothetical protein
MDKKRELLMKSDEAWKSVIGLLSKNPIDSKKSKNAIEVYDKLWKQCKQEFGGRPAQELIQL